MPKSPTPTDAEKKSKKPKSKFHPRVIEEFVFAKSWLLCEMMSQLGAEEVQHEIYKTMRYLMAPSGLKTLKTPGLHEAHSHDHDGFKYFKHNQLVAVHNAVQIDPILNCKAAPKYGWPPVS